MMDSWSDYYNRSTAPAEQLLYSHLLECAEMDAPDEAIARFRNLFIEGAGYAIPQVWTAMTDIVNTHQIEREYKFILNRCCYILVNRWLMQPRMRAYVPVLVSQFESPASGLVRSRTTQRLRDLSARFTLSDQYHSLKRLAQVIQQESQGRASENLLLGGLIHRYPYLYEHTLLTEDSDHEQRQRVKALRVQAQQKFEVDLSYYITQRKLRQSLGVDGRVAGEERSLRDAQAVKNPTLLSDRNLDQTLEFFLGRVDGKNTHSDLARGFRTYIQDTRCYRTFKEELHGYLIKDIDPKYGKQRFNRQLEQFLQSTLPQNDAQRMNDVLMVSTCRKLLNFLVIDSPQQPNLYVFTDLNGNLGATRTVGLLLKIMLICGQIRSYMERKFAILFNHFESQSQDSVNWIVESLETVNVALSTHFGTVKPSFR